MRRYLLLPLAWSAAFLYSHRDVGTGLVRDVSDTDALRLDDEALRDEFLSLSARSGAGPDIAVIVLDTTRADRLGVYGYDKGTTPHLDAWSAGARVFTNMESDATWTVPAHASLFTGKPPIAHGAHGVPLGSRAIASPLPAGMPTVAGALQKAGYRTVGIAANEAFLQRAWGLSEGFDIWMCGQLVQGTPPLPYLSAERVTALAKSTLAQRNPSEPLFLFVNYMDAHAPWTPREGFVRDSGAINRHILPYGGGWEDARIRVMADKDLPTETQRAWSEAYDAELRYLDVHLGELLDSLGGFGAVIVLGDHGEYLGEHYLVEHSKDVYETVSHVPLLVRGTVPGHDASPGRDASPIQTHDVARWILDAAGVAPLPGMTTTEDLLVTEEYWARKRDLHTTWGRRFNRIRRAYRIGDHKLILGTDHSQEAYDLASDPGEENNLRDAPWIPELRARGEAWLAAQPIAPEAEMKDRADVASLRALGYIDPQ